MKIEIDTDNPRDVEAVDKAWAEYLRDGDYSIKETLERAFAPIPAEPKNLGTIVRDSRGVVAIKHWMDSENLNWSAVTDSADEYNWGELAHPVTTISEGVPDEAWKGEGA